MKYETMTAKEILDAWKKERKVATYKELSELLGVSPNTLDTWKNRDSIPERAMLVFNAIRDFTNEEVLKHKDLADNEIARMACSMAGGSLVNRDIFIHAPIITAKAGAGTGAIHYDVETVGQLMIDRMMFKILPNLQNIRAVEVQGDSMYPTLKDGDYVVIEEGSHFSGEGIYVLQFDSMLLVKRLQGSSKGIMVLSDNKYYKEDEYIPDDDQRSFHIVGKVILRIQR